MLILTAAEVRQALPMKAAIEAMKAAFAALSDQRAEVPLRGRLPVKPYEGVSILMPAFVQEDERSALAVKIVSVFPRNAQQGLAIIQAIVLALEAETGRPLAILEGNQLTAIRTGAASGAATDLLARGDSQVAAIFGAGVQGRTQLEAVCAVRTIQRAWVIDPNRQKAEAFVAEMEGKGSITADLRVAVDPQTALAEADVVCTATTATTPVFADADLKPGAHINAVGSYMPEMQEIPTETVLRARIVVDSRSAALEETGDLIRPIESGLMTPDRIHAELGEIVLGRKPGREDNDQITLFKSVGVAVQDAMAARLAIENAQKQNLGQQVAW